MPKMKVVADIDAFIRDFPVSIQSKLKRIRTIAREEIPGAEEAIRYGIPTYRLKTNIFHFSAYRTHIAIYPGAATVEAFKSKAGERITGKGTIQFKLDEEIPEKLVREIIQQRMKDYQTKTPILKTRAVSKKTVVKKKK